MHLEIRLDDVKPEYLSNVLSYLLDKTKDYVNDWSATGPLIEQYHLDISYSTRPGLKLTPDEPDEPWMATMPGENYTSENGTTCLVAVVKVLCRHLFDQGGAAHPPLDRLTDWLADTSSIFLYVVEPSEHHKLRETGLNTYLATPTGSSIAALESFGMICRVLHQLNGDSIEIESVETEKYTGKEYAEAIRFRATG
jgi:hypothetical protein